MPNNSLIADGAFAVTSHSHRASSWGLSGGENNKFRASESFASPKRGGIMSYCYLSAVRTSQNQVLIQHDKTASCIAQCVQ